LIEGVRERKDRVNSFSAKFAEFHTPLKSSVPFFSCFLKSLRDQTGFPMASFPDFTDNFIECENRFLTKTWQFCGCGYEWHINGQTS
jgi:hypothetical protein